ncbi:MAG: type I secretion system permease/ATPase [Aeromonadaceae bacterium]|nr:type I secretion system permease/ATPase [Aeromonadaceae bacterium]
MAAEGGEQAPELDSGLLSLVMLARFHGVATEPDQLAHEFRVPGKRFDEQALLLASKRLGLQARAVTTRPERLARTPLPAIAQMKDGRFVILAKLESAEEGAGRVLVQSPEVGRPELLELADFAAAWSGRLILITSRATLAGDLRKFDFSWFIPAVVKYRKLLSEVLVVSLVLQLFALITPLFFQVVMDKVLVHRGFSTLDVIAVGLLVVVTFEVTLTALRSYIFAHTTSRIDVELGASLYRHLIALPLAYFQARRVGDSVARVRELENIRSFLTGNAITILLDLVFSVVFLSVMLHYSKMLTLIVVLSIPCYILLSAGFTPVLRRRLNEKFTRGAENQAFLVESVSGIDTLKSMAVEPQMTRQWDKQLAGYVSASFKTSTLSTLAGAGVTLVGKLVTVATLWFGARQVIDAELSVGQLIAFNMLAGQVAQPVMRLAQLWTDFQQTGISVQRLGDILNTPTEINSQQLTLPRLQGAIRFDNVQFRYRPDANPVLKGIELSIAPGEVIGVVGRSGSGKSTLTRLVQRLYVPEQGRVLIDGIDLSVADASSLRRQIGVVLQENLLFNRSIRENIALTDPGAPIERVMQAARLAGAHEFILELPEGYDTQVGEHGTGLSGGQRQRIAIARALLTNPRILIFDEATSALDYESERIIQQNMQAISRGRTVIIIAHRLSAVRHANRIVVLDRGQIVEQGSHQELLQYEAGHYARLLRMQQG